MRLITKKSESIIKIFLNPILPLVTKKPQTYQPRLRVSLLPTIRCRGWRAGTGFSRTGRLRCGGGCRGGTYRRTHSPTSTPPQHMGCTQWLGGWREETWKPATVGASLCHPDSPHIGASSRSPPTSWAAPPAFSSWHDDQGFSVKAEHCGGKRSS